VRSLWLRFSALYDRSFRQPALAERPYLEGETFLEDGAWSRALKKQNKALAEKPLTSPGKAGSQMHLSQLREAVDTVN
jgi:hypothetical protein